MFGTADLKFFEESRYKNYVTYMVKYVFRITTFNFRAISGRKSRAAYNS